MNEISIIAIKDRHEISTEEFRRIITEIKDKVLKNEVRVSPSELLDIVRFYYERGIDERGVPSELSPILIYTLKNCEVLEDHKTLRALFEDQRIKAWKSNVPGEGATVSTRVDLLINYLWKKKKTSGESGFVLFLEVLVENQGASVDAKETKVVCAYCGSAFDNNLTNCPQCQAPNEAVEGMAIDEFGQTQQSDRPIKKN